MKGTPGFVGARLKEAREARGLSATALAELLGVSRQAVSQYENDQQTPRPDIMQSIESILKLPPAFFWRPVEDHQPRAIFYRSMSAATKEARTRAERRYEWLREIAAYVRTFIQLPSVSFPSYCLAGNPQAIPMDAIEQLASEARAFWGLGDGPINNVVSLLENNGAIVTRSEIGADTLDSFSEYCKLDDIPYMFLGSDKKTAVRSRYDAAHELGHLLLHKDVRKALLTKKAEFKLLEDQAHRFAGAFLLPAHSFAEDLLAPTLDALLALKSKWRVAVQMMIHRGRDLHFISEETARRLYINLNRRKWRTREPMDDVLPCERPQLLRKAFEILVNERIQTRPEILAALPLAARDIEDLAGLEQRYLEEPPPVLNKIGVFRSGEKSSIRHDGPPGNVLDFPTKKNTFRRNAQMTQDEMEQAMNEGKEIECYIYKSPDAKTWTRSGRAFSYSERDQEFKDENRRLEAYKHATREASPSGAFRAYAFRVACFEKGQSPATFEDDASAHYPF